MDCVLIPAYMYTRSCFAHHFHDDDEQEGKVTKTVPFDKLTDCSAEDPAGKSGPCCCCPRRPLPVTERSLFKSGGPFSYQFLRENAHVVRTPANS